MDETVWYFTPAEFEVMMELSAGGEYSIYRLGPEPGDRELVLALASLYRRGFLHREGDALLPSRESAFFSKIRNAQTTVLMNAVHQKNAVICYVEPDGTVWMCELEGSALTDQYRIWRMDCKCMDLWLFHMGFLEPPILVDGDLRGLIVQPQDSSSDLLLKLERYRNGGLLICEYSVLSSQDGRLIRIREENRESFRVYTKESLSEALQCCFGKDRYDYRERESSCVGEGI